MRLLHTMIRVGDLDRSIAFYTEVLGMKLLSRKDYPDGKFTLAFVGFVDGGAEIELTYNYGVAKYELGTAFGHIAVEVDDAYKACDLTRILVKRGHDVVPLVTPGAERFVRAETFFALARLLSSFLYGVGAGDPLAMMSATLILLVVGMLAAVIPGVRASRTDPAIVLREQ